MSAQLFDCTKVTAYFLWEYTHCDNALGLWTCAEDIANFMEFADIFTPESIRDIQAKGLYSYEYIDFMRNIAFRIHVYSGQDHAETNWFTAERLVGNDEWCRSVTDIARIYYDNKSNFEALSGVRSEQVRQNHL